MRSEHLMSIAGMDGRCTDIYCPAFGIHHYLSFRFSTILRIPLRLHLNTSEYILYYYHSHSSIPFLPANSLLFPRIVHQNYLHYHSNIIPTPPTLPTLLDLTLLTLYTLDHLHMTSPSDRFFPSISLSDCHPDCATEHYQFRLCLTCCSIHIFPIYVFHPLCVLVTITCYLNS